MAVCLDNLPPPAQPPARPRLWLWLALLPLCLLSGVAAMLLWSDSAWQASAFWARALGLPLLVWSVLAGIRALAYVSQLHAAAGWEAARDADRGQRLQAGQRYLDVMAASVHTALRQPSDADGTGQLQALHDGQRAFKAQLSRAGGVAVRHSRLASESKKPQILLHEALTAVVAELFPTLQHVSPWTPLNLLLEIDSDLPEVVQHQVWQQVWDAAGLRHDVVPVDGRGWQALDHWLDHPIATRPLWLVIAVCVAPQTVQGSAEAAVGLLLQQPTKKSGVAALAQVHRPQAAQDDSVDRLHAALSQSLVWGMREACDIKQVVCSGLTRSLDAALSSALVQAQLPNRPGQGVVHLDAALGHARCAAPWLALACAAQGGGQGAQLAISGGAADQALWSTVVVPVIPPESGV